jgi:hypothetical protein
MKGRAAAHPLPALDGCGCPHCGQCTRCHQRGRGGCLHPLHVSVMQKRRGCVKGSCWCLRYLTHGWANEGCTRFAGVGSAARSARGEILLDLTRSDSSVHRAISVWAVRVVCRARPRSYFTAYSRLWPQSERIYYLNRAGRWRRIGALDDDRATSS